jgi:hypothetical protein
VSLVVIGMMEQADQQLAGSDQWHNLTEPSWRRRQMADFERLADAMHGTGAPVWWADVPYMKFQQPLPWISDAPSRTDTLNRMFRELDAARADVTLLDYARHVGPQDGTIDTTRRPDGLHLTDVASDQLVRDWLVPRITEAVGHR